MKIGDTVLILVNNPVGVESKDYKGLIGRIVGIGDIFHLIEIRFLDRKEEWYFRRNERHISASCEWLFTNLSNAF